MLNQIFKITLLITLLFETCHVSAQKVTPFTTWKTSDLKRANTANDVKDLSFQEKKVIYYVNLARINGKLFAETYLKDYMDDVRVPKNKYYRSLIKTLEEQESLPPLEFQEDLYKEAAKHAKEMGKTGKQGHRSGNKGFEERMEKFLKKYSRMKENNQYGFPDALSIVVDLLIDDDKESLTHRKTLLHKDLKYIGVGIRAHEKFQVNTCLLFAGELIPTP